MQVGRNFDTCEKARQVEGGFMQRRLKHCLHGQQQIYILKKL